MLFIIVRWELPFYLRNKINNYFSFKMLFHHKRYKIVPWGKKHLEEVRKRFVNGSLHKLAPLEPENEDGKYFNIIFIESLIIKLSILVILVKIILEMSLNNISINEVKNKYYYIIHSMFCIW